MISKQSRADEYQDLCYIHTHNTLYIYHISIQNQLPRATDTLSQPEGQMWATGVTYYQSVPGLMEDNICSINILSINVLNNY